MRKKIYRSSTLICALIMCICSIPTKAQQVLNLDFEKASIEGVSRPWGWDLTTYTETKVLMDSLVKNHGEYSLKMDAKSGMGKQVLAYALEPYALVNKTVTIDRWIKTNELKGSASFVLYYTKGNDTTVKEIYSKRIMNSTGWVRLSINAKIPINASLINFAVQHEGIGTAWFDNFSLSVNNTIQQELAIAPLFIRKQIKWLDKNAYPIKSVAALKTGTDPNDDDLSFFKKFVGDARIIALGESTHGTSEFFKLKHRLLEYSVKYLGVRVFVMEDHQLIVARVNKYVMGGSGTSRSSMYGMLGVWQTKEVHDLIEWVRTYNDDLHPEDKVEL